MCGICGFYQSGSDADRRLLQRMNRRIIHRGPDDEGYYLGEGVGLAARRLSIIDLETGHQPLRSHSQKNWIAYNGEVYNFRELRADLESKGYRFRTRGDTEVIVNLYEEYGVDFVTRLRGMFAVAVYDIRKRRLVLARDHVGIKPLFYAFLPGTGGNAPGLVFASEPKCILEYPGIDREVDPVGLDYFLSLEYIPAPYSIFKHIRKLPAGHMLVFDGLKKNAAPDIRQYWEVRSGVDASEPVDFETMKKRFHELLHESVKMRMIADVPLGAFLSGGIDSSAIVSVMAGMGDRKGDDQKIKTRKIKTFSIGFEEKSYSELKYSEMVSRQFGTEHHTRDLSPDISDLVMSLADFWDEPLGDFSNFPTYLVSKTAREKVKVVLSGDGGDEIFGGYEHYIAQKVSRFVDFSLFRPFHGLMARGTHLFPPSELKKGFVNRVKRYSEGLNNSPVNRHFRWMLFLSSLQKKKLYSGDFLRGEYLRPLPGRWPFDGHFARSRGFDGINQDLYLDFKTYMVDNILVKVDRMSMATSLEARVPLLDYKMVEFAFSLPAHYKLSGGTTKWFFKKAMEGILPDEIIYRRKEGFSIPIKNWLKKDLKDLMLEYLSEKRVRDSGYFNYKYVRRMVDQHLSGKQDHAHRLWSLILFHLWREKFGTRGGS